MLYLGVRFMRFSFKVTAMSQGFATIDQKLFRVSQYQQVRQWLASIKSTPDEPAMWFIDENDFNNPDYPTELFRFDDEYNSLFLVNHRALCDMMQFVREICMRAKGGDTTIESEFLLASAVRVFQQQLCKPLITNTISTSLT